MENEANEFYDKFNNLESEFDKLKNERLNTNENNQFNFSQKEFPKNNQIGMINSNIIENNNNMIGNMNFFHSHEFGNKLLNNFIKGEPTINIYFNIDKKYNLVVQAHSTDRLGNLFTFALQKNSLQSKELHEYKFYYDAKDVSSYFIKNIPLNSTHLLSGTIIYVYT